MNLTEYFYKESLDDIRFNVESIEFFKSLKIAYQYTRNETMFNETLCLLKAEQKRLLEHHKLMYDEDVDVLGLRRLIKNQGMTFGQALDMISQIEKSGIFLSLAERKFIDQIAVAEYPTLTIKQSQWLEKIWSKVCKD